MKCTKFSANTMPRYGTKNALPMPDYTDDEMAAYSGYRELVIAKECEG